MFRKLVVSGGGGRIDLFPGEEEGDSDLEMSKTRRPSVGDDFTQTRTTMIVKIFGRSKGDDGQKNGSFLSVGIKHGKKWVDKNGAKCKFGSAEKNQNTPEFFIEILRLRVVAWCH